MKPKGAPGRDRIAPRFIRALGPEALDFLLSIYNDSWSLGVSHSHWREALIVPLLKKGKPASQIDSFRPVSLTSCIAKTMERMVANRLAILAESSGWWSPDQAGFLSMRSCEDQVLRMSQSISNGFQTRPASRTVLALLDFIKAFDTVWRDRLYEILLAKGVPRMMVRWIRGFLTDRRARVRLDGVNGSSMKLQQGVPQGSVLSPLLFLFYINGIRDEAPEGTFISMYEDDIAVWSQHKDRVIAQEAVQIAVNNFGAWSEEHRLMLNPSKCEVAFFSTDPAEANWSPSIQLNGQAFAFNRTPTFLGVMYDRTLSFRPQAEAVKARVMGRIRIMASLASKEWGWSRHSLRTIYMATIHSVLHFCGAAWQPWLAKSNLQILERIQNRALRCLTGQLADTPLECLRNEAELTSFATTVRRNCLIAWEKSSRLPPDNPRRSLFASPVMHRWKNRNSFSCMGMAECEELGLDEIPRELFQKWHLPPWKWDSSPLWSVRTSLVGGSSKMNSVAELLADAIQSINDAGTRELTIYTDGSAVDGIAFGGSAAIVTEGPPTNPTLIDSVSKKGNRWTSSYETEVAALLLATEYLDAREPVGRSMSMICTDSQAALNALKSSEKTDDKGLAQLRACLARLRSPVILQWVPGHCGLVGNEWADKAAGESATSTDEPLPNLGGISYQSAKALIKREIVDPPTSHLRTKAVFDGPRNTDPLSRPDAVLIAQLRSGHCRKLAAYRSVVDANSSPTCPYCEADHETLEHWIQECPATAVKRIRVFGGTAPHLSVLVSNPRAVLAFAHGLWSM